VRTASGIASCHDDWIQPAYETKISAIETYLFFRFPKGAGFQISILLFKGSAGKCNFPTVRSQFTRPDDKENDIALI